ncbi:MAG: OmpA family protein [Phycisphaerae bacterium]|nr:OmpA family protein [Phycisphaerae bacterium]
MKYARISLIALLSVVIMAGSGCVSQEQFEDLKAQNRFQQKTISDLQAELNAAQVSLDQCTKQLTTLKSQSNVNIGSKAEEIAALEAMIAEKNALVAKLQGQLLKTGVKLPMELSVMLQDFAKDSPLVTFDEETGMLKFKSDLLFELGSDKVAAGAVSSIQALANIMKSTQAKEFDAIIAGHTDDVPIGKPETRAAHPTNWHLSVHRAISVLNLMSQNGVESTRVSVRGFGEYRPVAPNAANNKGNAANRRVEIFIVPKGA